MAAIQHSYSWTRQTTVLYCVYPSGKAIVQQGVFTFVSISTILSHVKMRYVCAAILGWRSWFLWSSLMLSDGKGAYHYNIKYPIQIPYAIWETVKLKDHSQISGMDEGRGQGNLLWHTYKPHAAPGLYSKIIWCGIDVCSWKYLSNMVLLFVVLPIAVLHLCSSPFEHQFLPLQSKLSHQKLSLMLMPSVFQSKHCRF